MSRPFDRRKFDAAYASFIVQGRFQEVPEYYPRYRSRYRENLRLFAEVAPSAEPLRVLEVGGGQHALLANKLYGDTATLADIPGPHFDYLQEQGLQTVSWNLCSDEQPFENEFDFIFFSEVIEHLPIPGHLPLERLRKALKPTGRLLCTTPNLHRLRNVVYLLLGKQIFDYFRYPTDKGLGHIVEYTHDHLRWQLETAGFTVERLDMREFSHNPTNPVFRVLSWVGSPLFLIPRYRDNLVALARPRPTNT